MAKTRSRRSRRTRRTKSAGLKKTIVRTSKKGLRKVKKVGKFAKKGISAIYGTIAKGFTLGMNSVKSISKSMSKKSRRSRKNKSRR
jgi:hypothetical protein